MPGPQVRRWDVYEALRRKHYSKQLAARIANSRRGAKHKPRPLRAKS
jgi:hypothetical protein